MKARIQKTLIKNNKVNSDKTAHQDEETIFYSAGVESRGEKHGLKEKIFIKYPDRMEGSGKRRIFISESGVDPFFEIFLWEDNNQKIRIDFHYSIHDNECLLSWNKSSGFVHSAVNSESPELYGIKKIQIAAGQAEFIWSDLREKYIERMKATYNIFEDKLITSMNVYREIKDILEFILKTIDDKYYHQ